MPNLPQYHSQMNMRSKSTAHKISQAIKWTVYALLILNFAFYIREDWTRAAHTLDAGSTFLDWTREFATSIDESAWFIILFMFELETYVFEDKSWKGWVANTVRAVRFCCYLMVAYTVYAFSVTVINLQPTVAVNNISNICDMVNADVSYVYNLEYTEITEHNCDELSDESQFYWVEDSPVISDMKGLQLERNLAWTDLVEAIAWLLIVLAIEAVVRMQNGGATSGVIILAANRLKTCLYLLLVALGIYWASLSHWLYLWDELLWIGGFAAIDMNLSQWRDQLLVKHEIA